MFDNILKLYSMFSCSEKKVFRWLLIFAVFTSLIEIIGVTAIMPFIQLISDFSLLQTNDYYSYVYSKLQFSDHITFTICFGILLIIFYISRSVINFIYYYSVVKFQNTKYETLSQQLFQIYIEQSYESYTHSNSSAITKNIMTEAYNFTLVIGALLFIISEMIVLFILYTILLYIDWKITVALTFLLTCTVWIVTKIISPKIKQAGQKRTTLQSKIYELINSSLGNFKILKLKSDDQLVLEKFNQHAENIKSTYITNGSLQHFPRLFLEAFAFSFLLVLTLYFLLKNPSNMSDNIGSISIFILGLYRLMPSMNRIITNYNQILFYSKTVDIIQNESKKKTEELVLSDNMPFAQTISLYNLDFFYKSDKYVLKNINLTIQKGKKYAFIGPSGSGKSTLIDIIIGLHHPVHGSILVDQAPLNHANLRAWRKKIGYIPQNIYLFDGTVAENIAMEDHIDETKVKDVLQKAEILDFLVDHHEGIDTMVGEGGIKLSGGQKQRIAIARALYTDPEILVLDEATSALDSKTEAEIMKNIYNISDGKTLLIIAHRLSTIEGCDYIYTLKDGEIQSVNTKDILSMQKDSNGTN